MPRKTCLGLPWPRQGSSFNEAAARCRGKLRDTGQRRRRRAAASMRPRPDAAENAVEMLRKGYFGGASMRPRPDAAENFISRTSACRRRGGFNEAAARCRGKLRQLPAGHQPRRSASMRPRPDAAENFAAAVAAGGDQVASMRPRPDAAENPRPGSRRAAGRPPRFNEAAARCRGKLPRRRDRARPRRRASMRPRPDAAENAERDELWAQWAELQ